MEPNVEMFPNVFKSGFFTQAGNNPIWTPAKGKKFRLLGFAFIIAANVAVSGGAVNLHITFYDGTTAMPLSFGFFVPQTGNVASQVDDIMQWRNLGRGILSSTAQNPLNINLSSTLTSGEISVNVAGTEEI